MKKRMDHRVIAFEVLGIAPNLRANGAPGIADQFGVPVWQHPSSTTLEYMPGASVGIPGIINKLDKVFMAASKF